MTAEVAVLNKTAVALAADSMVTISAGMERHKVFDTADKLFELSTHQPIGVMLYNGMSFMEMPLAPIIKDFRQSCSTYETIEQVADSFLEFLNDAGSDSPASVQTRSDQAAVRGTLKSIKDEFEKGLVGVLLNQPPQDGQLPVPDDTQARVNEYLDGLIKTAELRYSQLESPDALFVGKPTPPRFTKRLKDLYEQMVGEMFQSISQINTEALVDLCGVVLKSKILSAGRTGLVFAGFGTKEKFPTLVSVEIDGIVAGHLKYVRTHTVDIDRNGHKAAVLPFAQTEMVDRFVYGIDGYVMRQIEQACDVALSAFSENIINASEVSEARKPHVETASTAAKGAFLSKLRTDTLDKMRRESVSEIQSMVEFMPKPEMAKMAEALIELTSIKRRVTRGMETVGGPIDVAVISREEGFVWVKRKHYFSTEQNLRYTQRLITPKGERNGERDDS